MILILFFVIFISSKSEETEAMKAMDKKLFKAHLEKDLRNLENTTFKNEIPSEKEEKKKVDEINKDLVKDLTNSKEFIKKVPKVTFKYNQKRCIKFLDSLNKIYNFKTTNKGNIIIGNKIKNTNLVNKLYGTADSFYYPVKKVGYNLNKKCNYYFIKRTNMFIKAFSIDNSSNENEKGEIFDIFIEGFQEELY